MQETTGVSTDRGLPAALIAQTATFLGSTVVAIVGVLTLIWRGRAERYLLVLGLTVVLFAWFAVLVWLVAGSGVEPVVVEVAWVLLTLPLITTGTAVGISLPLAVVFVVVPLSDLLNALPVPGGIGGVEVVQDTSRRA